VSDRPSRDRTEAIDQRAGAGSSPCKIVVIDGPDAGKEAKFGTEAIQIGTDPASDLILRDDTVSRRHLEITRGKDGYIARDLGSTNGTTFEGSRIESCVLPPGAFITLGRTTVCLQPLDAAREVRPSKSTRFGQLYGKSLRMRQAFALMEKVAPTEATVLIEGPTGVGKDLAARAIHEASNRRDKPFVVLDCGAISRTLIESELFGHVRGAFTGAVSDRAGAFERAHGGSLFLDEIGELDLDLQPKLLRALEQREVRRLGGDAMTRVDVRLIAATNRDLRVEMDAGRFRQDLYYRLSVVRVVLPPLRERLEDVPLLVKHFLLACGGDADPLVEGPNLDRLMAHRWPGNVRELRNVIERAAFMTVGEAPKFGELDLQLTMPKSSDVGIRTDLPFKEAKDRLLQVFESAYLSAVFDECGGNISRTARRAGIDRAHLKTLLRKHGLIAGKAEAEDEPDE